MLHKFSGRKFAQGWSVGGGGVREFAPKAWPKAWSSQAKSRAVEIYSAKLCLSFEHKKWNLDFCSRANPLVALKMVNFAPERNARETSGFPLPALPCPVFLPLSWESVQAVAGRSYADVMTEFSTIHRFPYFFSYGGSARRFTRVWSSAIRYSDLEGILEKIKERTLV